MLVCILTSRLLSEHVFPPAGKGGVRADFKRASPFPRKYPQTQLWTGRQWGMQLAKEGCQEKRETNQTRAPVLAYATGLRILAAARRGRQYKAATSTLCLCGFLGSSGCTPCDRGPRTSWAFNRIQQGCSYDFIG